MEYIIVNSKIIYQSKIMLGVIRNLVLGLKIYFEKYEKVYEKGVMSVECTAQNTLYIT